jgi:GH24 family phage-related lysozyme (muramidase)
VIFRSVKFIAGWEQFVPWVYDDKVKPVRMVLNGKRCLIPPKWVPGTPVKGTLTFGFGHTDAAKHPMKCRELLTRGTDLTLEEAYDILHVDLSDVVRVVNSLVKVTLTQSQADALYSITFNFGEGNLRKSSLLAKLNRGDYAGARAAFDLYVTSKGAGGVREFMPGLQNRRDAEQKLWDADAQLVSQAASADEEPVDEGFEMTPKGIDGEPRAKPMLKSKIGNSQLVTAALTATGSAGAVVKSVTDGAPDHPVERVTEVMNNTGQIVGQVKTITDAVPDVDTVHRILTFLTDPVIVGLFGAVAVVLCGLTWYWRRQAAHEGDY